MIKLMLFFQTQKSVSADQFRDYLAQVFYPALCELALVENHLRKAVHHHVIPMPVRAETESAESQWRGVASYYFDSRAMLEALLASPEYVEFEGQHRDQLGQVVPFLVEEVEIYHRHKGPLPVKGFALFKRLPKLSRLQALQYYQGPHAEVGETLNKGRIAHYIQNHVLLDYQNPVAGFEFDGGPEIAFKSMAEAVDLYGDVAVMQVLSEDEAKFVRTDAMIHFLADELRLL